MRERLQSILDGRLFHWVVIGSIFLVILGTVPSLQGDLLDLLEILCGILFVLEFIGRTILGGRAFLFSFLGVLDGVALISFLPLWDSSSLVLLRLIRLVKLQRYAKTSNLVWRVIQKEKDVLLGTFTFAGLILILSASLVFVVEHDAQPEVFSSIPMALWWAVATLTTVGYGDIFPVTFWGRIFSAITATLGVGIFALPASVLGAGIVAEMEKINELD